MHPVLRLSPTDCSGSRPFLTGNFRLVKGTAIRARRQGVPDWPSGEPRHPTVPVEGRLVGLVLAVGAAICLCATGPAWAQPALRVFLDCVRCDDDRLRVVDREDAQVHVLVTRQPSGGGTELTFAFIGREAFAGRDDEVRYFSSDTDTADERREGIAQTLQLSLLPYLAGTPLARQVETFHDPDAGLAATQPEDDPWKFWRFRDSTNANFDTEESQRFFSASGAFSADRTTEAWKIRLNGRGTFRTEEFDFGDGETFTNTTTDWNTTMLVVRSLGNHWGVGVGGSVVASTFVNQDRTMRLAPAIEYSVFPYAESTRRQVTFTYAVGANALDYEELTIFGKTSEFLTDETLTVSLDVTQPWGRSSLSVEASHFFDDIEKYRSVVFGNLELRVFRGLSLEVFGSTSLIRDQVFLPARGSRGPAVG